MHRTGLLFFMSFTCMHYFLFSIYFIGTNCRIHWLYIMCEILSLNKHSFNLLIGIAIYKVKRDPNSSSTFILDGSCTSSMAVIFISNLLIRHLEIFLTSFFSHIFSPITIDSLALYQRHTLKLEIDSSWSIVEFSNLVVRSRSLDMRTLDFPSQVTTRIFV